MSDSFKREALPSSADQQSRSLREEIEEVYRANERLANDYDAAEIKIRELEALLARLNVEREETQRKADEELAELRSTKVMLTGKLLAADRAAETQAQEVQLMRQQVEKLEKKNADLIETQNLREREATSRAEELEKLTANNAVLQKELDGVKGESASIQSGGANGSKGTRKRDLTAIEGIGPKIRDLLHASGIATFDQLAKTDVDAITKILSDAGPRFASRDPGTWPEQAKLAAKDQWEELDRLQQELKGGRRKR